jgi:hypothetical protein
MTCFLMLVTIPIGGIWLNGTAILKKIVLDDETVLLAGLYLKVIVWGAPGYAMFESGKRFVQAQGLFNASLYVLLIGAPFNFFLNWLLIWISILFSPGLYKALLNFISSTSNWALLERPLRLRSQILSCHFFFSSMFTMSMALSVGAGSHLPLSTTGLR